MVKQGCLLISLLMSVACWAARDPTMPMTEKMESVISSAMTVNMILVSGERKFAVIDGNFVREGDRVRDEKIVNITPDYVTMEDVATGARKDYPVIITDIKLNAH